jgi:hypothetical protein
MASTPSFFPFNFSLVGELAVVMEHDASELPPTRLGVVSGASLFARELPDARESVETSRTLAALYVVVSFSNSNFYPVRYDFINVV